MNKNTKINKIHKFGKLYIAFFVISIVIICIFSEYDNLIPSITILNRPSEGTLYYNVLEVLDKISWIYIGAFIAHLIEYYKQSSKQKKDMKIISKKLTNIHLCMDSVINYIKYLSEIDNLNQISEDENKRIDDISLDNREELLMVICTRDGVMDGKHMKLFDGRKNLIDYGTKINEEVENILELANSLSLPDDLKSTIVKIKISDLLYVLTKIMPEEKMSLIVINMYSDFAKKFKEFVNIYNDINQYEFLKLGNNFRKATDQEVDEYESNRRQIKEKYPNIDEILKDIT